MSTDVNKRTQSGWNNWMKMAGVLCDKSLPKADRPASYAARDGDSASDKTEDVQMGR